ncbi:MAG: hypothetical protein B7X95_05260 [Methylophilaceae bacterium 17-44-8]|nr:MAG: hypothetical protein B7X95_05260 [Methylophilaceae bacterium 17-44-8]
MNTKSYGTDTKSLSVKQRRVAGVIFNLEAIIQKHLHENVEAQTVMFLLEVAYQSEATDLTSVGNKLGISKAAASRNFYRLADGKGGEGGLDLIKSLVDYNDRRRTMLTLTPKGIEVVQELVDYLESSMGRLQDAST